MCGGKRATKWMAIGLCSVIAAVAVYAIYQSRYWKVCVRDPKVEKVRELIAEADGLLHQFK